MEPTGRPKAAKGSQRASSPHVKPNTRVAVTQRKSTDVFDHAEMTDGVNPMSDDYQFEYLGMHQSSVKSHEPEKTHKKNTATRPITSS